MESVVEPVVPVTEIPALPSACRRASAVKRFGSGMANDSVLGDSLEEATVLVRAFTTYFSLVNRAEDNQRVRRIRAHEHEAFPAPRRGSLREAIGIIADRGAGAAGLQELLAQAEVRLVLTAHPTEARRRTTVAKLARVFATVRELDERQLGPEGLARRRAQLAATIQELWSSDEIRA